MANPVGVPPGSPRRRDAQATRRRLLEAAADLFAERGYDAATVRDIADRAGANQALLFRYFGSKSGLLTEVMAHSGQEQLRTTPPEKLFETTLRGMLTHHGKEPHDRSLAVYLRSVGGADDAAETVKVLGEQYADVLATLSGAEDAALRADLAMAWLLGIGMMRVVVGREPLASAHPDEVCELVLGLLRRLLEGVPAPEGAVPPESGER
ncbi:TetR/AcrR family transcriptional regulator [Streptomyces benahoarensis]|uniref:TetR/AcrR family transcriptional regulator n=1 Tax=Streptomyces benahoarensis TaxID=2595054 RepID=A0A553YVJ1_9ACTN|nr:TetR/AcrR family transcriptional regulator [Streptomyces benahoarensis]TSB20394.1 TetR/AcrR family transcriptional regulator [Streptomyces benahoarensis]TSB33240.1 TetR/AcrR family transcriptional regulator [Streptomyces benahoarensis]